MPIKQSVRNTWPPHQRPRGVFVQKGTDNDFNAEKYYSRWIQYGFHDGGGEMQSLVKSLGVKLYYFPETGLHRETAENIIPFRRDSTGYDELICNSRLRGTHHVEMVKLN